MDPRNPLHTERPRTDRDRSDAVPPGFPAAALVQQDPNNRPWTRGNREREA